MAKNCRNAIPLILAFMILFNNTAKGQVNAEVFLGDYCVVNVGNLIPIANCRNECKKTGFDDGYCIPSGSKKCYCIE